VTDYGKGNGGRSTALAKTEDSPPKTEAKQKKKDLTKKAG